MFGDRKDGKLLRKVDGMHFITPIIFPKRCDNEAYISQRIDLDNLNKYIEKKNSSNPEYKYNQFQCIVVASLKVLYLRPKMNYFIKNSNLYERKDKTAAFVVKKLFKDDGQEGLAIINSKENDNINTIHTKIHSIVTEQRLGDIDPSSKFMDKFARLPRFLSKFLVHIIMLLDRYGKVPSFLIESDPYYCSILLTNLGSIKLDSGYHHLANWGTNSLFIVLGEYKTEETLLKNGKIKSKQYVDLGLTIDERIADGYYFSRSLALLKKLLENPELLELPLNEEIDY